MFNERIANEKMCKVSHGFIIFELLISLTKKSLSFPTQTL